MSAIVALNYGSANNDPTAEAIRATFVKIDRLYACYVGLTPANDKIAYFSGPNSAALADFTATGRSIVAAADQAGARTAIGAVIGTDVEAHSANLDTVAAVTPGASGLVVLAAANAAALRTAAALGTVATLASDTDVTLAANSNANVATQAAVKTYVDNAILGLKFKQSVRAATTANGTLATAFANGQAIDGVTLATGDRILIKNQTSSPENGIYVVAASGAPTRATDGDSSAELISAAMMVQQGSTQADTLWTCSNDTAITIGSTSISFAQVSGATGGITALTGDVTASGSGSVTATIANSAVTLAKMANMATASFLARTTGGAGAPEVLSATQATAILNAMVGDSGSGGTKGLVPAPASGDAAAGKFLKADGAWTATATVPAAAAQSDQETATSTTTYVSPGRQQYHPGACKEWLNFNGTGTAAIRVSYGVSSITDNGVGLFDVNHTTSFSSANYGQVFGGAHSVGTYQTWGQVSGATAPTASKLSTVWTSAAGSNADPAYCNAALFGDQ